MAQAEARNVRARDGIFMPKWRGTSGVVSGYAKQFSHPAYEQLLKSETFLRQLVPVLIVLFLAIAATARGLSLQAQSEFIAEQVNSEMHFIAELVQGKALQQLRRGHRPIQA